MPEIASVRIVRSCMSVFKSCCINSCKYGIRWCNLDESSFATCNVPSLIRDAAFCSVVKCGIVLNCNCKTISVATSRPPFNKWLVAFDSYCLRTSKMMCWCIENACFDLGCDFCLIHTWTCNTKKKKKSQHSLWILLMFQGIQY